MRLKWPLLIGAGVLLMVASRKAWSLPNRGKPYAPLFATNETQHGMPTNLLARQAQKESNFNPNARSPAGAVGLMQVIPKWHPTLGEAGALDPERAVPYAASYLATLKRRFGTWGKALAAYNWGQGNLSKHLAKLAPGADWISGLPKETRDYVNIILGDLNIPIK
jgi:soluble lytic murein transglycosylase-like protein